MAENKTPAELIKTPEFEAALNEGATYKQGIVTTYKQQNRSIYKRFQEVMYESNQEIKAILAKKKKNRDEVDNKKLSDFKTYVSQTYKQTVDLISSEKVEEGKKSKVEKIVDKIVPVIEMLTYIEDNPLSKELNKRGIAITGPTLWLKIPTLADEEKKKAIQGIFAEAKAVREKINSDNEYISTEIYSGKVPIDLQYDKKSNNAGLKPGDFKKLVDIKTKLNMAKTDKAKEKVEDVIEHIASEKQFESARAELVRDSLTNMQ